MSATSVTADTKVIVAQHSDPAVISYLQPYAKSPIRMLRDNLPNEDSPVTMYFSTTDRLADIEYTGDIVGWEDKGR